MEIRQEVIDFAEEKSREFMRNWTVQDLAMQLSQPHTPILMEQVQIVKARTEGWEKYYRNMEKIYDVYNGIKYLKEGEDILQVVYDFLGGKRPDGTNFTLEVRVQGGLQNGNWN